MVHDVPVGLVANKKQVKGVCDLHGYNIHFLATQLYSVHLFAVKTVYNSKAVIHYTGGDVGPVEGNYLPLNDSFKLSVFFIFSSACNVNKEQVTSAA